MVPALTSVIFLYQWRCQRCCRYSHFLLTCWCYLLPLGIGICHWSTKNPDFPKNFKYEFGFNFWYDLIGTSLFELLPQVVRPSPFDSNFIIENIWKYYPIEGKIKEKSWHSMLQAREQQPNFYTSQEDLLLFLQL